MNSFKENLFVRSIDLTNMSDKEYFRYVDYDKNMKNQLVLEHVIDLLNRQIKFIAPHVLMKGYKYKLLFTDKALTNFALSIDNDLYENQYLYKKMFLRAFPFLFSIPIKNNLGLPLNTSKFNVYSKRVSYGMKKYINTLYPFFIDPNINYLDFSDSIRNRKDLKTIIYNSIMDLKSRKIIEWIDIESIWHRHTNKSANHADALLTLASLEIHLKAGKKL